jgi:hypothetical protein
MSKKFLPVIPCDVDMIQRELEVLCSKNIIRNFIPMVKMFWLSGTADRAITYIRSVELNGNWEHKKK